MPSKHILRTRCRSPPSAATSPTLAARRLRGPIALKEGSVRGDPAVAHFGTSRRRAPQPECLRALARAVLAVSSSPATTRAPRCRTEAGAASGSSRALAPDELRAGRPAIVAHARFRQRVRERRRRCPSRVLVVHSSRLALDLRDARNKGKGSSAPTSAQLWPRMRWSAPFLVLPSASLGAR
jgi:hypothetical protein